jgi:Virulence factor BrkB
MGDRIERSFADRIRICEAAGSGDERCERRSKTGGDRSWPAGRDPLRDPGHGLEGYFFAGQLRHLGKPHPAGSRRGHLLCPLAIFPGIAALISIYGVFADPASVAGNLDTMANVAPGGAIHVLREEMNRLASQGGATLGASFLVSLAISLWTANSGVNAIFDALNIVYGEEEKRSFSQTQCYHATRHAWNSCLYPAHARSNCRHTGCFSVYPASGSDSSYR